MKKLISILIMSLLTGCAYKGAIDSDFYQSSASVTDKINARATYHQMQSKYLRFRNWDADFEEECAIDVSKGMNNALEKLIEECFQDNPTSGREYVLQAIVENDVDFSNDLKTTIYLGIYDRVTGQLVRKYSASNEVDLNWPATSQILMMGTALCLFVPAPITMPLATKISGNHYEGLIEENLTADFNDLSYDLYRDRYLLERRGAAARATRSRSTGSGFFVSKNGYVLADTNLIKNATKIVVMHEGQSYRAVLVKHNTASNLALLKCEGEFPYMSMTDKDSPIGKFLSEVDGLEFDELDEGSSQLDLNRAKKASVKVICY